MVSPVRISLLDALMVLLEYEVTFVLKIQLEETKVVTYIFLASFLICLKSFCLSSHSLEVR